MNRNTRILLGLGASLALLLCGAGWWLLPLQPVTVKPLVVPNAPVVPATQVGSSPPTAEKPLPESDRQTANRIAAVDRALREGSLRGSTPDGAIEVDASGRLKNNLALRRWFDYYLSLVGEVPPQALREWLAARIRAEQDAAVAVQVIAALDRYLAYLADVDRVAASLKSADAAQRLQLLKDLRRQHLGADQADGFFADEEAYGDYTLLRRQLARDESLTESQRQAQLDDHLAKLPESVRAPLLEFQGVNQDLELSARITEASADPDTRFSHREQAFGPEAAARLEQLDQEQASWKTRLASYQEQRAHVQEDTGMSAQQREQVLRSVREQLFDANERLRIEALEQAGAL